MSTDEEVTGTQSKAGKRGFPELSPGWRGSKKTKVGLQEGYPLQLCFWGGVGRRVL